MLRILYCRLLITFFFLALVFACGKKPRGHFSSRSYPAPEKEKRRINRPDINDCEAMGKNRQKSGRPFRKTKQKEGKSQANIPTKDTEKLKENTASRKHRQKVHQSKVAGNVAVYVAIGVALVFGLGAVAFVIALVIFTLASLALSLIFVPLILTLASLIITSIGFVFLQLYKSLQRRRRKRRERRQQEEEAEKENRISPPENQSPQGQPQEASPAQQEEKK